MQIIRENIRTNARIVLDTKDKAILRHLEMNSRQPISRIAKKVKLSKEVVNYRIKNLIKNKVIELFITPYNYTRMGYFSTKVLIKFNKFTPAFEKRFIAFMKKVKHVYWLAHCSGDYDIQLSFQTRSMNQLEKSFSQVMKEFSKEINKRHFSMITEKYNLRHNCIYDKRIDMLDVAKLYEITEQPSKLDFEIMKLLKRNSRMPVVDIAKKLKITPTTAVSRIKGMVKSKWIKGFFIRLNMELLGYSLYNVFYKLNNLDEESERKFISYLCSRDDIGYVGKMIGGWDLDLEIQAKNEYQFNKIISEINSKFSKNIRNYTYLFTIKKYPLYTCEV